MPRDLAAYIKVDQVKPDLYLVHNARNDLAGIIRFGGNVAVYLTDDGVILFDSKNAQMHDFLVAAVRKLSRQPIRYLVLTHSDGDHAGGAAELERMGVTGIISTADRALLASAHPSVLPQIAFHPYMQFSLGSRQVQLREFCGHTAGDVVAYLPNDRVVIVGDLVTSPEELGQIVHPNEGGDWNDAIRTLDTLAKLDFDLMIQGHGPVLTKAQFLQQRARMVAILHKVGELARQGRSEQQIRQALLTQFHYGAGPTAGQIADMMVEEK